MKKNILFITMGLSIGGIETYIIRLSKHLKLEFNIKVLILRKNYNAGLLKQLESHGDIYFISDYYNIPLSNKILPEIISFLLPIDYQRLCNDLNKVDYIHSTGAKSMMIGNELLKYNSSIILTTGIYHTAEHIWDSKYYFRNIEKSYFMHLHDINIQSCNESTIKILKEHYGKKRLFPIVPLGIELKTSDFRIHNLSSNRIVSIGRLAIFKTYNEHIIKTIDDLNEKSHKNFEYHIYGKGANEKYLRDLANKQKSKIVFHGTLEYSNFSKVLEDCFVFVGSGTAIIEAASNGIPSIIGIEHEKKGFTYGLFSDIVGYSYNEDNLNFEKNTYLDVLLYLISLNIDELREISKRHLIKSSDFSIKTTSNIFIKFLYNSKKTTLYKYNRYKYSLSYLWWSVLNSLSISKELRKKKKYGN